MTTEHFTYAHRFPHQLDLLPSDLELHSRAQALAFPPTSLDRGKAAEERALLEVAAVEGWEGPALDDENIAVPEWLIPPAVDEDGEILPSEQHPSRPLGDPYALTYTTPYASQPKLSPRLHMHASLFSSGPTAAAAAALEASAPLRSLPNHLALRAATTHAPRPPTWPFRQFGPGPRNASFYSSGPAPPLRQVWADLALESLLPRGNEKDPIKDQVDADRANLTPEAAAAGIPKSAGDRLASLELAIFGYDQAVKFKKENEEKIAGGVWTGSEPEPQPQPQPQRAAPWRWGDS